MTIIKILLVFALLFFWVLTCVIFYFAGIMKGFRNFIEKNANEWTAIDKILYQQFTHKNLDNVNPFAQYIAEGRIKEFNDKKEVEQIKNAREKLIKKTVKKRNTKTKKK
tara:strand:- start:284 stop:610 length:327 start_codon:yes stop_codon:yes gene_type:complete